MVERTIVSEPEPTTSSATSVAPWGDSAHDAAAQPAQTRRKFTRRSFLRACAGGLLGAGATGAYARFVEPHWAAIERFPMELPGLAPAFDGLKLLQISDLHVSAQVSSEYMREQLARCTALRPDVIVITGDFITAADTHYIPELTKLLGGLQAPRGIFAVLGNHDFGLYSPLRQLGVRATNCLQKPLTDCGITVLRNQMVALPADPERPADPGQRGTVGTLQLVGLDDWWSKLADPVAAFAAVDPGQPCILLTHNPDSVPTVRDRPWHWALCGHTHGGQVRIPFFGAPLLPIRHKEYDQGLFELGPRAGDAAGPRAPGQRLYVNRGLGHLMPIRFNCRPEITVFTLRSAPRGVA